MTTLAVGLPLGGVCAFILVPVARQVSTRLLSRCARADFLANSAPPDSPVAKLYLDYVLAGGLCLCSTLAVLTWGVSWDAWVAILYCATLQVLARIDAQTHLLPDMLTLPLLWAGLMFHWLGGWVTLSDAVAGAAAGYGVLWLIWAAFRVCSGRDGIGFGDLKLAAANGAWLGIEALPWMLLLASLAGCVAALCRRVLSGRNSFEAVAFGPYLAMGGILMLFCTQNSASVVQLSP